MVVSFSELNHVEREVTYESPTFKGNSCKILFNKVDILISNSGIGCVKFVAAFKKFSYVAEACFTVNLNSEYKNLSLIFDKLLQYWYSSNAESTYDFLSCARFLYNHAIGFGFLQ